MHIGYPSNNDDMIHHIIDNKPLELSSVLTYLSTQTQGEYVITDEEALAVKRSIFSNFLTDKFPNESPESIKISPYFPQPHKEIIQISLSNGEEYLLEISSGKLRSLKEYRLDEKMLKYNVLVSALFEETDQFVIGELKKLIQSLPKSKIFQCGTLPDGNCIIIFESEDEEAPIDSNSDEEGWLNQRLTSYCRILRHTYIINPKDKSIQQPKIVKAGRMRDGGSTYITFENGDKFDYKWNDGISKFNGKEINIF